MHQDKFEEFYQKLRTKVPCRGSTLFLLEKDVKMIWEAGRDSATCIIPTDQVLQDENFSNEGGQRYK